MWQNPCERFAIGFTLLLVAGNVPSPAHLSLTTIHHRSWGSLYAALSKGRIDKEAVRELPAYYPMAHAQQDRTSAYAVDVASWQRSDAGTSAERGYYYHPIRHSAVQPIVADWPYQLVTEI